MAVSPTIYRKQLFASTPRTSTPTSATSVNTALAKGCLIVVNTTLTPGSAPSTVFTVYTTINGVDYLVLTGAAITATGQTIYQVYAGGTPVTNVAAGFHPGRKIKVTPTHGNANSVTYDVQLLWLT